MWCTSHVHNVYVDICTWNGKLPGFELWHVADNISGCFECDSSSNMCFGCSKEPSHWNGETVLLSKQDKCLLLRNQVICHLRILIWRSGYFFSRTFSKKILQWRQRTVEANCLKFWNLFCKPIPMRKRICISMLCCCLEYWSKACSGDLYIFRRWEYLFFRRIYTAI